MARGVEEVAADLRARAAARAGPRKSARERIAEIDWFIAQTALKYGVRPEIIKRIIKQESGGDPNAVGKAGEIGLMQLMPDTARQLGVTNPRDPKSNIEGGVRHFAEMLRQFGGNEEHALAAYNAGAARVRSALRLGQLAPPMMAYVRNFRDVLATAATAGARAAGPVAERLREPPPLGPLVAEAPRTRTAEPAEPVPSTDVSSPYPPLPKDRDYGVLRQLTQRALRELFPEVPPTKWWQEFGGDEVRLEQLDARVREMYWKGRVQPGPVIPSPPRGFARLDRPPLQAPPEAPPSPPRVGQRLTQAFKDVWPVLPPLGLGALAIAGLRGRRGPRRAPEVPPRELPGMPEGTPKVPRATEPEAVPEPQWSKRATQPELPSTPRPEMPPTAVRRPGQKPVEDLPLFARVREELQQKIESMQQRLFGPEARPFEPERAPAVRDFRETAGRVEPRLAELERRAAERPSEGVKALEPAQVELPKPRPVEKVRAPVLEAGRPAPPPELTAEARPIVPLETPRAEPPSRPAVSAPSVPRFEPKPAEGKPLTVARANEAAAALLNALEREYGGQWPIGAPVAIRQEIQGFRQGLREAGESRVPQGSNLVAEAQRRTTRTPTEERPGVGKAPEVARAQPPPPPAPPIQPEPPPATTAPGGVARAALMPPIPLPGPTDDEKRPWVRGLERAAQVAGMALPLLGLAAMRGRGRGMPPIGRPGGAEAFRPPEVLPQFRRESIRPPETPVAGEAGGGGGGGRGPSSAGTLGPHPGRTGWGDPAPPVPPGRVPGGPSAPATPGPFPGVPGSHVDGSALWRGARELTRGAYATILGRLEGWGPAGAEVSRRIQRVGQQTAEFHGRHGTPLLQALHDLTGAQRENFRKVADGLELPKSRRVARIYQDLYRPLFGEEGVVPREAQARNILQKLGPEEFQLFQPRAHFFPREFDPEFVREVLRPQSSIRRRAIEQLMEREAIDVDTAAIRLDDYFGAKITRHGGRVFELQPDRFVGGLERVRKMDIDGYITDPEVAIGVRLWKVSRRFAEIDHYGLLDAHVGSPSSVFDPITRTTVPPSGLIGTIQQQFGRAEATKAYQLFERVVGMPGERTAVEELARRVMTVEAFTKLPLSFVVNATQPVLTALRTDILTAARGVLEAVVHPQASAQTARELGTLSRESMRQYYAELTGRLGAGDRATDKALSLALKGFDLSERANIITASTAGRVWAGKLDGWLQSGQRGEWMGRELERLNFSLEEIDAIRQAGRFRPGDHERVAWGIVDQTQFLLRRERRSEFFSSPLGQAVGQFKSFSINSGRLMHQMVVRELRHGDPRAVANVVAVLGILFPIVGEVAFDVRSLFRGRPRGTTIDTLTERILEDFFFVAGFGVAADFLGTVAQYGARGAGSFLMGPGLTDAITVAERALKTATAPFREQGDLSRELRTDARFLARNIPYIGPQLAEALRGDPQAVKHAQDTWQQRLGIDPIDARLRRAEQESRRIRKAQQEANRLAGEGKMEEARKIIQATPGAHLSPSPIARRRQQIGSPGEDAARRQYRERINRLSPALRSKLLQEMSGAER